MKSPRSTFGAILQTASSQWLGPSAGVLGPLDPSTSGLSPQGAPLVARQSRFHSGRLVLTALGRMCNSIVMDLRP